MNALNPACVLVLLLLVLTCLIGQRLLARRRSTGAPTVADSKEILDLRAVPCKPRRAVLFESIFPSIIAEHRDELDAIANDIGVRADVGFAILVLEAARLAQLRVNFTTIVGASGFIRAAAAGKRFSGETDTTDVHNIDWSSVEPTGRTYKAASRALVAWFGYYDSTAGAVLLGDFIDGKSFSFLQPLMARIHLEAC